MSTQSLATTLNAVTRIDRGALLCDPSIVLLESNSSMMFPHSPMLSEHIEHIDSILDQSMNPKYESRYWFFYWTTLFDEQLLRVNRWNSSFPSHHKAESEKIKKSKNSFECWANTVGFVYWLCLWASCLVKRWSTISAPQIDFDIQSDWIWFKNKYSLSGHATVCTAAAEGIFNRSLLGRMMGYDVKLLNFTV